jgi:hypothetical protein
MRLGNTLTSAFVVAVLGVVALPAVGQERNNGHERGGRRPAASQPAERSGGGGGGEQAAVRQAAPPPSQGSARSSERPQSSAPPAQSQTYSGPQAVVRGQGNRQPSAQPVPPGNQTRQGGQQAVPRTYENRQYGAQPVPRGQAAPRQQYGYGGPAYGDRGNSYGNSRSHAYMPPPPRYYARPYSGHAYVRPYGWTTYRPYYFARPYYSFSPWFSIGFGLSIGYPVSYPWTYLGTYRPRVYGDYDNSYGYSVTQDVSVYGGLSFDIQPSDADVWVDGQYVGTVKTFTPYGEPLTLTPGQHHIVVQRDGFRGMEWDVTVEPGQVIPYRGAMQRY